MAFFCCYCGYKVSNEWFYCPRCGELLPKIEESDNSEKVLGYVVKNEPEQEESLLVDENILEEECCSRASLTSQQETSFKHPILPRKVDWQVFEERMKEYRLLKAREEHKSPAYIFDNKALCELSEARNRILIKQDLNEVKYWSERRIEKYGDDIIDLLNLLDQNYIP